MHRIDKLALTVLAPALLYGTGAQAQSNEAPLYLECKVTPGAQVPAGGERDIRDRVFQIKSSEVSEWNASSGQFERYSVQGWPDPTLEITPLWIVYTRYENYIPGESQLQHGEKIIINRQDGGYRLINPWFGNPFVDVTGKCIRIAKPQPPATQF